MPQSFSAVYLHLVFSTKGRRPYLSDAGLRADLHAFLASASRQLDCPTVVTGGVADHVHMLARHGRTITQADWVKEVKRVTCQWLKGQDRQGALHDFSWQSGYGLFSVSASRVPAVRDYILDQEHHHRQYSFQDEFRKLLQKHKLSWDEKYIWD